VVKDIFERESRAPTFDSEMGASRERANAAAHPVLVTIYAAPTTITRAALFAAARGRISITTSCCSAVPRRALPHPPTACIRSPRMHIEHRPTHVQMRLQRIEELRAARSFLYAVSRLYKRGAAHRINYDTPSLGGNCWETSGRSGATILASER
jgi:hypothetical protein